MSFGSRKVAVQRRIFSWIKFAWSHKFPFYCSRSFRGGIEARLERAIALIGFNLLQGDCNKLRDYDIFIVNGFSRSLVSFRRVLSASTHLDRAPRSCSEIISRFPLFINNKRMETRSVRKKLLLKSISVTESFVNEAEKARAKKKQFHWFAKPHLDGDMGLF